MRKINTSDVCKMARIMKASGMREKIFELFKQGRNIQADDISSPEVQEFGVSVVFEIIEVLAEQKAERELYELIGGIVGKSANEIAEQEFTTTIEDVKAIAKENDLVAFFSQASNLMATK